ncbi:MazG-like family protein [Nonomuraea turcica]|uniref:MazG-like family protein n=1 Tax=Nonomuraea sp. G32 TaxID=3067274 RepID=UPI00273B3B9C|nr:MazG-like family protein [Nonomuraea sp. G32]MDP4501024.1 MazG-like family protein [Nonomuraea sp. G32]
MTTTTDALFEHVGKALTWIDRENGRSPQETVLRLLKLAEETGEVAAAYIGMVGQNPRKGVTHTVEDVADELCDVTVTALVALATITGDANTARAALDRHIAKRAPRLAALTSQADDQLTLFAMEAAR